MLPKKPFVQWGLWEFASVFYSVFVPASPSSYKKSTFWHIDHFRADGTQVQYVVDERYVEVKDGIIHIFEPNRKLILSGSFTIHKEQRFIKQPK
jgi:hypothetical protein